MDPVQIPGLHGALKVRYGRNCHWNLNALTTHIRKMAITAAGLDYLLKCCRHHVYPKFVSRSVRFYQLGHHLERLAEKITSLNFMSSNQGHSVSPCAFGMGNGCYLAGIGSSDQRHFSLECFSSPEGPTLYGYFYDHQLSFPQEIYCALSYHH